jgi:hypothetical protein
MNLSVISRERAERTSPKQIGHQMSYYTSDYNIKPANSRVQVLVYGIIFPDYEIAFETEGMANDWIQANINLLFEMEYPHAEFHTGEMDLENVTITDRHAKDHTGSEDEIIIWYEGQWDVKIKTTYAVLHTVKLH